MHAQVYGYKFSVSTGNETINRRVNFRTQKKKLFLDSCMSPGAFNKIIISGKALNCQLKLCKGKQNRNNCIVIVSKSEEVHIHVIYFVK